MDEGRAARGLGALTRWRPTRRQRRRLVIAGVVAAIAAVFGAQQAPYARIAPGPTPDLTTAVADAQGSAHTADPKLDAAGRLLATTVDATQVTWFTTLRCGVTHCPLLPVDTSDPSTVNAAAQEMATSQQDAATEARRLTQGRVDYPHAVLSADLGDIGGPSAGLMLTLTFVDALTAGDLTGGHTIAGTGTIAVGGQVGPISGIAQKVQGASAAGATVFFAPTVEAPAAQAAAPAGITVVPVATDADALRWLCHHGGTSRTCPA